MEALCRVSQLKALPTDKQIEESGQEDGGAFLLGLEDNDNMAFKAFLKSHDNKMEWGDEHRGQPIARRVEHLVHMIVRVIEGAVTKQTDMQISHAEIVKWVKNPQNGFMKN